MLNRRYFMVSIMAAMTTSGRAFGAAIDGGPYFAPAEEAPHARTWLCWASTPSIYGGGRYFEDLQESLARLARSIAEREPVTMLAGQEHHATIRDLCGQNVEIVGIETDDMWARDNCPLFLKSLSGKSAILDLNFNGWGGKQRHNKDTKISASIAELLGRPYLKAGVVGEGGGLEFDGDGTLLLTDSCWVNDNRNPGLNQEDIEAELKRQLGIEKVIWLPGVRGRDITDGHIDGAIRVVRPGLLMTSGYPGDRSEWGQVLDESKAILAKTKDARGRNFEIVEVPHAIAPRSSSPDLFTSYANYYVGNGAVYTPEFGDKTADSFAVKALAELYPGREIVLLNVDRLYENGGGIHCVTQQEPA
ncbi:MAG: agmatine deiminase family protein [Pseudomonadota bacterium]